jgi:hypothetical protein
VGRADCGSAVDRVQPARHPSLAARVGALQLLVVQHGGRESVEMFEVITGATAPWQLAWRGCAVAPEGGLNDVVALPEGGFLVTRFGPSSPVAFMFAARRRRCSAARPAGSMRGAASGILRGPGTRAAGPNGIELSADGAKIFLNTTLASEVLRIDRKTGAIEARASVTAARQLTWARDGRLRVASLRGPTRELLSCTGIEHGSCPMPFAIVALDPNTMETQTVYEGGPARRAARARSGLESRRRAPDRDVRGRPHRARRRRGS